MSHEPECDHEETQDGCRCTALRAAYRRGYNDAKRTRIELESMFGPYIKSEPVDVDGVKVTIVEYPWVHGAWPQHGKGENP